MAIRSWSRWRTLLQKGTSGTRTFTDNCHSSNRRLCLLSLFILFRCPVARHGITHIPRAGDTTSSKSPPEIEALSRAAELNNIPAGSATDESHA